MTPKLGAITGALIAGFHTALTHGETRQLRLAVIPFAGHFRRTGATSRATVDLLQRFLDQAANAKHWPDPRARTAAEALTAEMAALCVEAFAAGPKLPCEEGDAGSTGD